MIFTRSNPPTGFYVYAYLREDGTPYYIGKGIGIRAWVQHRYQQKNVHTPNHKRIVILESNLTEIGAYAIERRMILWYGRKDITTGILRNLTEGGNGGSSFRSTETRKKISLSNKGKNSKPQKASAIKQRQMTMKSRTYDEIQDWKAKISQSLKGKITSPETIEKIRMAKLGKKRGPYKKSPGL